MRSPTWWKPVGNPCRHCWSCNARHCRELITGQERVLGAVREFRSTITLCVAGGAMLGSLYSLKCQLHPVSVLLVSAHCDAIVALIGLVAFIRRDAGARFYVLPMAAIGACISGWHYLIEWRPGLDTGSCSATGPSCTDIWFRSFGFLTLAGMASIGFLALIVVNAFGAGRRVRTAIAAFFALRAQWHVQQMSSCALNQAAINDDARN